MATPVLGNVPIQGQALTVRWLGFHYSLSLFSIPLRPTGANYKKSKTALTYYKTGAPRKIRTPDPQIRSLVLYPAELSAHKLRTKVLNRRGTYRLLSNLASNNSSEAVINQSSVRFAAAVGETKTPQVAARR